MGAKTAGRCTDAIGFVGLSGYRFLVPIGNSPFNREVFSMQSWKQQNARVLRFAMAFLARPRLDDFTLFAASLAILGTILVLFRQVPYGAGITGDAVAYLNGENPVGGKQIRYLERKSLRRVSSIVSSAFGLDRYFRLRSA